MAYGIAAVAVRDPSGVAVTDGEVEWTWPQLNSMVNSAANFLHQSGPDGERRVAIMAENTRYTALAHLAATYAGMSVVPVNCLLTASEAGYIFADADVDVVLCSARTAPTARAANDTVRVIAWGGNDLDGVENFDHILGRSSELEPSQSIKPAAPLYYTSGTTGAPKGVSLPEQMFPGGANIVEHVQRIAASPLRPTGKHLIVSPMHHTGPIGGVRGLTAGTPLVIAPRFDAENTLRLIERHRVEVSMMVPTHFSRLLALPTATRTRYDISSIRTIIHTGAPCPIHVKRAMIEWFGPALVEAYGSTEVGTVTMIDSAQWLAHPGSVGRAMPGCELSIRHEDGSTLGVGESGLVCVRSLVGGGPRYHKDPEKTRRSYVSDGVFSIGEIGHLDEGGYLFLTDRMSDMVVSGGVNVYPAESEAVLRQHPSVEDVAVIGVPHTDRGEQLCAVVVASGNRPEPTELIAWCRERLTHYKCPTIVEFVDDDLRTTMGKVNKRELRDKYLGSHTDLACSRGAL